MQRYSGLQKVANLEIGNAIIFDHLILHNTEKSKDVKGARISIDISYTMSGDSFEYRKVHNAGIKKYTYRKMKSLSRLGLDKFCFSKENLSETQSKLMKNNIENPDYQILDFYDF